MTASPSLSALAAAALSAIEGDVIAAAAANAAPAFSEEAAYLAYRQADENAAYFRNLSEAYLETPRIMRDYFDFDGTKGAEFSRLATEQANEADKWSDYLNLYYPDGDRE